MTPAESDESLGRSRESDAGKASGRGSRFWDLLLIVGLALATAAGVVLVVAPDFPALGWLNRGVDRAFFDGTTPAGADDLRRWLYAVEGATLAGFGILGLGVAMTAFRRREPWARNTIALAIAVWFPLDTVASVGYGVWQNALLNVGIAVVLLLPVVATWRRFSATASQED